jgi:hypothetical protein
MLSQESNVCSALCHTNNANLPIVNKIVYNDTIMTPFYKFMGVDIPTEPTALPEKNYTAYNLFCLHTKLQAWVYKNISSSIGIYFVHIPIDNKMYESIILRDGYDIYPLEGEEFIKFQSIVDSMVNKYPNHCILHDFTMPMFTLEGKQLSPSWSIEIGKQFYISPELESFISDGKLYINFSSQLNSYNDYIPILQSKLSNYLQEHYDGGVLFLTTSAEHKKLIEDWELEKYPGTNLYEPSWRDMRIAPHPFEFLLNRELGKGTIHFKISNDDGIKHIIAKQLQSYAPIFTSVKVLIDVKNLIEARKIANVISMAENAEPIKVATVLTTLNFISQDQKYITYRMLDGTMILSWVIPKSLSISDAIENLERIISN